jgi:hypothetical protein
MSNDPYGLREYTSQSLVEKSAPKRLPGEDPRGNTILAPRSVPTQAEVDAMNQKKATD